MIDISSAHPLLPNQGAATPERGAGHVTGGGDSVFTQASAALADFQSEALAETAENVGFALGARRGSDAACRASADQRRNRVAALKLVAEVASVEGATLDGLLAGADDWLQAVSPRAMLEEQTSDHGRQALMLAAALARGGLSARQKNRLEEALAAMMQEEGIALSLFGALNFGVRTPALRQELHHLYRRTSDRERKLSEWLTDLGKPDGRRQKLTVMIQVLAYELSVSGEPIVGNQLAMVIGDLKRLLNLLGLESHCQISADKLAYPEVDGEWLLQCVVSLSEQLWADADLVAQTLPQTVSEWRYPLVRTLYQLIQVMPARCFVDDEHQGRLLAAFAELRDRYAD